MCEFSMKVEFEGCRVAGEQAAESTGGPKVGNVVATAWFWFSASTLASWLPHAHFHVCLCQALLGACCLSNACRMCRTVGVALSSERAKGAIGAIGIIGIRRPGSVCRRGQRGGLGSGQRCRNHTRISKLRKRRETSKQRKRNCRTDA